MGWSEKLIELSNSWFSPKELSGLRHELSVGVEHWKKRTGRKAAASIKLRIPSRRFSRLPDFTSGEVRVRQLDYGGEAPLVKRETAQIAI